MLPDPVAPRKRFKKTDAPNHRALLPSLGERAQRDPTAQERKSQERKKQQRKKHRFSGQLFLAAKGKAKLGGIFLLLHLDGKDYQLQTQEDGSFFLKGEAVPKGTSLLLSLPGEEFFFPLTGIDWVEGPAFTAPLLAKVRARKKIRIPILPWAKLHLLIEGPQGQKLDFARIFIRPLASPASLGKERYRLPGRQLVQDPPLGPGLGTKQNPGRFLCEKIPPKIDLHLLVLGQGNLRAETTIPALRPGQIQKIVLRLTPGPTQIKTLLRVLDLKGETIPGARAWLFDQSEKSFGRLRPSPSHHFRFHPPQGGGRIRVWAPGFLPNERVFHQGAKLPPSLNIQLTKGGQSITLQTKKNGKPLSKIPIHARELPIRPWSRSWTVVTDQRGITRLRGLGKTSGLLLFFGDGRTPTYGQGVDIVPDPPLLELWQIQKFVSFSFRKGAKIEGLISGFHGDPLRLSLLASYSGIHSKGPWKKILFNLPLEGEKTKVGFHFFHRGLPRGTYKILDQNRTLGQFSLRPGEEKLGLKFSGR
jgi:hypothetical protein